ncbi:MAG: hypothetical protein JRE43_08690 [Deltaproteobacteria bacterium]|nr:hypothetical protein [Deltaproteobacteria bacterium]MBW2540884.1 hypothetical protein [Deltaproteobacteria bacterium]
MKIGKAWKIGTLALLALAMALFVAANHIYPDSQHSFDSSTNGIWVGHRWYTGREVRSGDPVPSSEIEKLVERLRGAGIRYVYVHAGPLLADGSIEDSADPFFSELRRAYPEGVFFAWLGARIEKVRLGEEDWRSGVVDVVERLAAEGFDGVHFDLEPLRDGHPGYLELLAQVRKRMGGDWTISQATPRATPLGIPFVPLSRSFWSGAFYRATMDIADQTVLMAYDTNLPLRVAYVMFVRDQTRRLAKWSCDAEKHEFLIGIPAYHDVPEYSDPSVENIGNAALGVRSALEAFPEKPECFRGVSIYANWVTDPDEWLQFERHWRHPGASVD